MVEDVFVSLTLGRVLVPRDRDAQAATSKGTPKGAKRLKRKRPSKPAGTSRPNSVTSSGILSAVVLLVERLAPFAVPGVRYSKRDMASLLVYASARRTNLSRTCEDLADAMSDSRLRQLWRSSASAWSKPR